MIALVGFCLVSLFTLFWVEDTPRSSCEAAGGEFMEVAHVPFSCSLPEGSTECPDGWELSSEYPSTCWPE
ncbi:MAG: hypothetical protein DRJ42_22730 [Deltaproteobacteria bacterium]|nr:MAG: hypothetical protein DRJ42_22730 [Deltaproteobacteria bacterium]